MAKKSKENVTLQFYNKNKTDELLATKIDTAGNGLSKSGTTLNHSNSVTAQTAQKLGTISYDAQGHITGFTEKAVVNDLTSTDTDKPLSANQGKVLKELDDAKLPLAGGTMTGTILSEANYYMRGPDTDTKTTKYICGGQNGNNGASLQLSDGTKNGYFYLKACDTGTNSCYLQGTPAGALTWGDQPIFAGHLYYHNIYYANSTSTYQVGFIINTSSTAFTASTFASWLYSNGFTSLTLVYSGIGGIYTRETIYVASSSGGSTTTSKVLPYVATGWYSANGSTLTLKYNFNNNVTVSTIYDKVVTIF